MVVQRYRHAKLLIDECKVVTLGLSSSTGLISHESEPPPPSAGLLVYISFAISATRAKVEQAAKTVLNLPVLTLGAWGDGTGGKSVLQLAKEHFREMENGKVSLSLLLVPQANLTSKVKRLGKSIQYRDQIAKSEGQALYDHFIQTINYLLTTHHATCKGEKPQLPNKKSQGNNATAAPDPSIPPQEIFHPPYNDAYGSFDESSILPRTLANGEPLTKSALKKLQKVYDAHTKRHTKFLEKGGVVNSAATASREEFETTSDNNTAQVSPLQVTNSLGVDVVAGSFGKRQGLELQSDMGPFCHVVELE